jgi:Lrp/AsnC ligand binding domain
MEDIYVFYRRVSGGFVDRFRQGQVPSIRYAAAVTGPFGGVAVKEIDTSQGLVPELVAQMEEEFGDSPADVETAEPIKFGATHIRRSTVFPWSAWSRVKVEPGHGAAVLDALDGIPGYNGSAIVRGDFDILVDVGAGSEQDLNAILLALNAIGGVRSTVSLRTLDSYYRDAESEQ